MNELLVHLTKAENGFVVTIRTPEESAIFIAKTAKELGETVGKTVREWVTETNNRTLSDNN